MLMMWLIEYVVILIDKCCKKLVIVKILVLGFCMWNMLKLVILFFNVFIVIGFVIFVSSNFIRKFYDWI